MPGRLQRAAHGGHEDSEPFAEFAFAMHRAYIQRVVRPEINGSSGGTMIQKGTMSMTLFFVAALISFGDAIYGYTHGRATNWYAILFGVAAVCFGIYFKTVKRPT
jgi:hypothetical protein